jgi:Na+-transporting methylmalonyl-CoA/oxaloacetate decarboxylase beta subunit
VNKTNDKVPGGTANIDATKIMVETLVSTSLRVFVPVLVLFGIGVAIDFGLGYKPWGMTIGAGAGIIIAAALVVLQLRKAKGSTK